MKENKLKERKELSSDTKEVKNLIIITLVVAAVCVGLYFLTDLLSNKKSSVSEVEFDNTICTVGTMFDRPYDEYYVFLFDSTSDNASQYKSLLNTYTAGDDAIKTYYVDLHLKFNSSVLSDTSNTKPTSASDLKIKDSALILIKDGVVSKYYENVKDYENILN